ncbi:nucleolar complex protein 14 [Yamadazyma tenuis]|uniref:Nop14-like protein n=1 Tax=Candida tenuis (strain ATCC 10573 / BCRC 21748 / CBS 615 / JCM 9827 / NBRC 10315 / NRRL Y-1498 / VKM Y-70) TaxID=590646 RepID=G3B8S0_CANTC|nr:uncharacterized protein CANTEDRAFT_126355 [Yamadazyma tenuis ATCC 10573]EGV62416.1 hypothetical protein CANTEDRAFT_126355 [Yamadazyma tenuis ATCC 10573]WEJ93692.1 nucleolar complex protein 14 [Yamadazyma tenuis]
MAGSQLKKLKAELKSKGLVGQTNTKSRNKRNKAPSESRKSDKEEILQGIRSKFNVFDARINRVKRDVTIIENGKFVKMGESEKSNPTKSNSFMNKNLKIAYDLHKSQKGKNSRLVDRRFGENSGLSQEERMLQRFVKERESSSKRNKFSIESDEDSDDDDEAEFMLSHDGKTLAHDEEFGMDMEEEPTQALAPGHRKTKAEVMKEIIAKSKFHKAERQKVFRQTQNEIDTLDDQFQDIFQEAGKATKNGPQFSDKKQEDILYDERVRGLVFDKRAVPADRTKTQEELETQHNERLRKIEDERAKRMEGERDAEGDDLDQFWGSESDEESSEKAEELDRDDEDEDVSFPLTLEEFSDAIEVEEDPIEYVNKIIKTYKPHLKEGNKDRMNKFVAILFKYVTKKPDDELIKILKKLSESYNEELVGFLRAEMQEIQVRIGAQALEKSDLVYFALCGLIFSSSDKYHLIIIPNLILMNEILSTFIPQDMSRIEFKHVGQCLFIIDTVLQYQRLSKRFEPEVNNSLIKILKACASINGTSTESVLSLDELFVEEPKVSYVNKTYELIDRMSGLYKEYSSLKNFIEQLMPLLSRFQAKKVGNTHKLQAVIDKLNKLSHNIKLTPLVLQAHRKIAIKTLQPKFEENFNPGKSYDLDLNKQEVNKMRAQLKKEKKETLKDIRKQNAFETNERLSEKIKMYDEYHSKMSKIVNSISTIEGKEKNDYEKEKKRRK